MKYLFLLCISICFISCGKTSRVIRIKGSDTEVNLAVNLAEQFHQHNSEFSVAISGGGSGMGIASLLNGQADIANSSRPLTKEEQDLFEQKKIRIRTVVFAEDATAFVVHQSNPIDSIEVTELARILSGASNNWSELTDFDRPVTIYGRQSNSGTHSFVQKKLGIHFSRTAREMNGNAQILEAIKQDMTGIGYVGAGYLINGASTNSNVKILKIIDEPGMTAVSPLDATAIKNQRYFFQRPLYQFILLSSWQKVQPFLAFEMSESGRALIEKEGYYNITKEKNDADQ